MPHGHIKIGDSAAFMGKGEILEIDNDDMGRSGGESTSQFQAYGGNLNHDLENTKSTSTMNDSSSQFFNKEYKNQEQYNSKIKSINIEEDKYINVLES